MSVCEGRGCVSVGDGRRGIFIQVQGQTFIEHFLAAAPGF